MTEETLSKTTPFEGGLLTLEVHQVRLADGSEAVREIVLHQGAVCCVVVTPDNKTVLVKQYRKAVEKPLLEIPAGKIDPGEDPDKAIRRELQEEVGFVSGDIEHLMDFYASPGFCNEKLGLYLARNVLLGDQNLDPGEFLEIVEMPLSQAKELALVGRLGDAKSVAGILAACHKLGI